MTPTATSGVTYAGEALVLVRGQLAGGGVENPALLAEWLVADAVGCSRLELPLHRETAIDEDVARLLDSRAARVAAGCPVQYALGSAPFMDHAFFVDERVLIPRPETEVMVERILLEEELWNQERRPVVVDVGTGSGCILLSLALARPRADFVGRDVSEEALAVARKNAARLGVSEHVRFEQGDLLEGVSDGTVDLLVSNPPYIESAACDALPREIKDFEPAGALDGGPDGLRIIDRLVQQGYERLKQGGLLWFELGETQGGRVVPMMKAAGFVDVQLLADLAGRDRMVRGKRP